MISPRFYLVLVLLMFIIPANSFNYAGTLTGSECKAYFASDDINKNLQALFSCPKKWRLKSKKRVTRIEKHSPFNNEEYYNNNK